MYLRKTIVGAALVVAGALAVDRVVLYAWQHQVIKLFESLHASSASSSSKPRPGRYGYVSIGLEPLLIMPKQQIWPIRYLTLTTDIPLAKPNTITVDAGGGLHLRFLPPALAWTTWTIPRFDFSEHADPVAIDPRFHYEYKIDIEPVGDTDVAVTIARGPYHFAEPLGRNELHPQLFP
jgi:hypothetical protein